MKSTSPFPAFRYVLTVDSGSEDEPAQRRFKSLTRVWDAYDELDPKWRPFAEVRVATAHPSGGIYWPKIDRLGRVQS
jgi:hypothetical protein